MELKKYFENPHSFNVNTCGHGMPLKPYASVQEALAQEGQFSKQVTPLSKNWAYFTFDGMQDIPHELFSSQTPLANTQIVSFPYSVENQDEAFPFLIDPPYVPANNPVQVFAKNLTLNRADDGQQRFLSIEGIYNSCYVYLNGQLVGYSGQPGQSVQFDCTPHFQTGPNRLVLIVVAHSAASYLVPYVHFGIVSKVH
ncbi:MAG: hypothetical protein IKM39_05425, partial [Clostridia bacterium]|nr:hypothetical protein [Clostridia bacterium]